MRLIDADDYAREMNGVYPEYWKEVLDDVPTVDAVPVVRCKDCKHNYANMIPSEDVCSKCVELPITADFFCKWGERIGTDE